MNKVFAVVCEKTSYYKGLNVKSATELIRPLTTFFKIKNLIYIQLYQMK